MHKKSILINILHISLLLIVFSVTFDGLSVEIGATFRFSRVFSLFATFILFVHVLLTFNKLSQKNTQSFSLVLKFLCAFLLVTLLGNITFLLDKPNPEAQSYFVEKFSYNALSVFRNELKSFQAFVENASKFSCLLIPILVIRSYSQVITLAWTYVISSSLQAALGILQFIYYVINKINLFPLYRGGLIGESSFTENAVATIQGTQVIRVNALSGEPKALALFLCFGIATTCFFLIPQSVKKTNSFLLSLAFIQLLALALTLSTLGYILFSIGVIVFISSAKKPGNLIFILILSLTLYYLLFDIPSVIISVFQARFLGRIGLEDMDLIYLAFIQDSPSYLFLGTGFGTFHLASYNNALEIIQWKFGIILPKLGIFEILAISGIFGLVTFSFLPYKVIGRLSYNRKSTKFYGCLKLLIIYMIIAGVYLRLTYIGLVWMGIGFAVTDNRFINLHQSINREHFNLIQQY